MLNESTMNLNVQITAMDNGPLNAEEAAHRAELIVAAVTDNGISPKVAQTHTDTYGADCLKNAQCPALTLLQQLYHSLEETDRVEVLVFSGDNKLKYAMADSGINGIERNITLNSKAADGFAQMANIFDEYTHAISVGNLTEAEKEIAEYFYDEKIIEMVQNA